MTDHRDDPARDREGHLIGGVTARAPGIQQDDDLSSIVGAGATDADVAAAELAKRRRAGESTSGADPTAPGYPSGSEHLTDTGGR